MRKFNIRVGINENIDNLIIDINGNKNISGAGINHASRIEGQADPAQILVGNSVYEKLVQREKYMKAFNSYTALVKHGLPLKVHQLINKSLLYLNNEIPDYI
jgi:class 3 adenylate cyclase